MKIALFVPDLRGGGVERVRVLLAKEFLDQGHSVDLLLLQRQGELLDAVPAQVRIVDLGAGRARSGMIPLIGYLRRDPPDALIASMWPLTTVAVLAAYLARFRGRLVVSEHAALTKSKAARGMSGLALRGCMRWINWRADAVVGASTGVVEALNRLGLPWHVGTTIHNPVEISGDTEIPEEWKSHPWLQVDRSRRVLAVGSLKAPKDYPTLLQGMSIAKESGENITLLILGVGALRPELEHKRRELGLDEHVHFGGFVSDPGPFYRAAGLFVLSSAWEGFGNVLVEALAAGTPVVSTDCESGPAEILQDGRYGRLVPVGDPAKLAEAIQCGLSEARDPAVLKERAQEFRPSVVAKKYQKLLT